MIDANLATFFDCHHSFPSSSPLPPASPRQGSGSNSQQHAAKFNARQRKIERRRPIGRNQAQEEGGAHFLDSSQSHQPPPECRLTSGMNIFCVLFRCTPNSTESHPGNSGHYCHNIVFVKFTCNIFHMSNIDFTRSTLTAQTGNA